MGNTVNKEEKANFMTFSGDDNDAYKVANFIADVEVITKMSNLYDADIASNAIKAMTGKALTWVENLKRETPEVAKDWSKLKFKLVERFAAKEDSTTTKAFFISQFDGEDTNYSVERFIFATEHVAKIKNLTENETVEIATKALTGNAKVWLQNVVSDSPEVRFNWQLLKSKLESCFGNILSLKDRLRAMQGLVQRRDESSDDFFDRVSAGLYSFEDDVLSSAGSEAERKSMIKIHHLFNTMVFTSGLQRDVRNAFLTCDVATRKTKLPSVDEIRQSVRTCDESIKKKQKEAGATKENVKPEDKKFDNVKTSNKSVDKLSETKRGDKMSEKHGHNSKTNKKKADFGEKSRNNPGFSTIPTFPSAPPLMPMASRGPTQSPFAFIDAFQHHQSQHHQSQHHQSQHHQSQHHQSQHHQSQQYQSQHHQSQQYQSQQHQSQQHQSQNHNHAHAHHGFQTRGTVRGVHHRGRGRGRGQPGHRGHGARKLAKDHRDREIDNVQTEDQAQTNNQGSAYTDLPPPYQEHE